MSAKWKAYHIGYKKLWAEVDFVSFLSERPDGNENAALEDRISIQPLSHVFVLSSLASL